jgi:hypothetical protein
MTYIKNFLFRLYLLTYSPLFPTILTLIIFMSYRIYFEPVLLCDDNGGSLFLLKKDLAKMLADYRTAEVKYEKYTDLSELWRSVTKDGAPADKEITALKKSEMYRQDKNQLLIRVHQIEDAIKKLDPHYRSVVIQQQYPRIARSSWI